MWDVGTCVGSGYMCGICIEAAANAIMCISGGVGGAILGRGEVPLTLRNSSVRRRSRAGFIFLWDWISFHSLAAKYVRQMLTGDVMVVGMAAVGCSAFRLVVSSTPLGRSQSMKKMSIVHWCHTR